MPKLPSFDTANVALWIGSAEAEFEICHVVDPGTKRAHILATIPAEHRLLFQDFLLTPDTSQDGYASLINHIRNLFQEKPRQRAARILRPHNLNGHTPSQFLAALKNQMSGITMEMIAKEILAGVLPPNIRAIVTTDTNSPADMATAADAFFSSAGELLEQSVSRPVYTAAFTPATPSTNEATWEEEQEPEAHLEPTPSFPTPTTSFANVCAAYRGPQRGRPRPSPRNHHTQPQQNQRQQTNGNGTANTSNNTSPGLCFYHRRFGDDARNCRDGCPRWGNARAGGQQ